MEGFTAPSLVFFLPDSVLRRAPEHLTVLLVSPQSSWASPSTHWGSSLAGMFLRLENISSVGSWEDPLKTSGVPLDFGCRRNVEDKDSSHMSAFLHLRAEG